MRVKLFFLFLIILKYEAIISYRCGFDSIKKKPKKIKSEKIDEKRQLSNDYNPIKIKLDFTMLESQNILNSKNLNDLINIFNEIVQYLS